MSWEDEESLDSKKRILRLDQDPDFDWNDGDERELELNDPDDLLRGSDRGLKPSGGAQRELEEFEFSANFLTDDREFIDLGENRGVMAQRGGGSGGSLEGVRDLIARGAEDVLGRVRQLGSLVMGTDDLGENDDRNFQDERLANLEGNEGQNILSARSGRNQNLGDNNQSNRSNFLPLDEIVRGADRENIHPSVSPKDARQLGEVYVMQLNSALGTEFESLVSEYLSDVDGLLGADQYEIQQRVETGVMNANGNLRFVVPDMMLFQDGELTNVLEMKVGLRGLKLKDIEYVSDFFPESAVKYIFLKSSENKEEEWGALQELVDEYIDQNDLPNQDRRERRSEILGRMEVWGVGDVAGLLPEDVNGEFLERARRISELSLHQNEDYTAAYNSYNRLRELTDELKGLVRGSVDGENEDVRGIIEDRIGMAEDGGNAYQSYINMAILQKVAAEKALSPGDLQSYLGLAENTTLTYTNPLVVAGAVQHTEIYPGTAFLYFQDEDRPTFFDTLRPEVKAGFELMQREGILPQGEVTHYDAVEILGDRPQRKATVFSLFANKDVIGEQDIANLINESHLESAKIADREMKWMYNNNMIDREQLPWDSGHYYYWLKSEEIPDFGDIRQFMDCKTLQSIEFIENKANYQFDNFNDIRKFFSTANTKASLEKSWREIFKILPIVEELQNKSISIFRVDEFRNRYNQFTDSNITRKTIESRLNKLINNKILMKNGNSYTLNDEFSVKDIESKINSFSEVRTLNYSDLNFELDINLKLAKKYALNKLTNLGFDREIIIELRGSGQKINYLIDKGNIDIYHASSLKTLLPEYKDKTITEGLRKLSKIGLLERYSVPYNLNGSNNNISYYKQKGGLEASFYDLKDLLDDDIKSSLSNIQNITKLDVWKMSAGDFRFIFQERWLQDLQVFAIGHNLANNTDGTDRMINLDQLDQKANENEIFKSNKRSGKRAELTRSLNRLSKSNSSEFKIRKIDSQLYEFYLK